MADRRRNLNLGPNDHVIGCPLCLAPLVAPVELTDEDKEELSDSMIDYLTIKEEEKEIMPHMAVAGSEGE